MRGVYEGLSHLDLDILDILDACRAASWPDEELPEWEPVVQQCHERVLKSQTKFRGAFHV